MTKKQKAALAVAALEKEYPDALCSLEEKEPYRLLIAVRLSAQCTDARVSDSRRLKASLSPMLPRSRR